MSQQKLPPEVQQTLAQYQSIRDTYVKIDAELRLIESELTDIDHILDTLKSIQEEPELYKMVGHILIKRSREEVVKELEERKEFLSIKKDKYKKQLTILEKQLNELEAKIKELLQKHGITVG